MHSPQIAETSWTEGACRRLLVSRGGQIASSFPWESGFRTAVEVAERRGIGAKLVGVLVD